MPSGYLDGGQRTQRLHFPRRCKRLPARGLVEGLWYEIQRFHSFINIPTLAQGDQDGKSWPSMPHSIALPREGVDEKRPIAGDLYRGDASP